MKNYLDNLESMCRFTFETLSTEKNISYEAKLRRLGFQVYY